MAYKNILSFILLWVLIGTSCQDPYNDVNASEADFVNNDNPYEPTPLDNWLHNTFTLPYNIEVKYRWDNSELDPYKTLMPPAVNKVQGVMEVVKNVWIDTYNEVADADFIKEYCPKQFVLVGSANYNYDGTYTIGTAEGGRKIILFVLNKFDPNDNNEVKQLIHTVQHEFAHILHQTNSYPSEFKEVTAGSYTANWSSVPIEQARASGFITSYAMASTDEDFVEMIATMLVEGKHGYEQILACQATAASRALLRRKEQFVVDYFRDKYKIDFYALQTRVQEAINEIAPGDPVEERPSVHDVWGYGKTYTSIKFDFNFFTYPQGFTSYWAIDYNALSKFGYGLGTYFRLFYSAENQVTLQLHYHTLGEGERLYYTANFVYNIEYVEEYRTNAYRFSYEESDDNARKWIDDYQTSAVAAYFGNYLYQIEWERNSCPTSNLVGFYPVTTPNVGETYGVLGN